MLFTIIQIILTIVVIFVSTKFFMKGYKDTDDEFEKSLYILLSSSVFFLLLIYYLDRYNIPSLMGYTKNVNSSDWVSILTNYSAVIISTLLNAAFLIFVTFRQMDETYKDNVKLNSEIQRLQNLPLLRYDFTYEKDFEQLFGENKKWIFSNNGESNNDSIDFTIEIENIGLNAVRKVYLEIKSELFKKKENFQFCNQSNIEKGEMKKKEIIITNVSKGTHKIDVIVYYQDLLKNWYEQKVHLLISVTNVYDSNNGGFSRIESVIVDDDVMLLKEPTFIKKIK